MAPALLVTFTFISQFLFLLILQSPNTIALLVTMVQEALVPPAILKNKNWSHENELTQTHSGGLSFYNDSFGVKYNKSLNKWLLTMECM